MPATSYRGWHESTPALMSAAISMQLCTCIGHHVCYTTQCQIVFAKPASSSSPPPPPPPPPPHLFLLLPIILLLLLLLLLPPLPPKWGEEVDEPGDERYSPLWALKCCRTTSRTMQAKGATHQLRFAYVFTDPRVPHASPLAQSHPQGPCKGARSKRLRPRKPRSCCPRSAALRTLRLSRRPPAHS